jgi:hypothetical protein
MNVLYIRCQKVKGGLILISFFFSTSPHRIPHTLGRLYGIEFGFQSKAGVVEGENPKIRIFEKILINFYLSS